MNDELLVSDKNKFSEPAKTYSFKFIKENVFLLCFGLSFSILVIYVIYHAISQQHLKFNSSKNTISYTTSSETTTTTIETTTTNKPTTTVPSCVNTTNYQLESKECRIPFYNSFSQDSPLNPNPKRVMIFARWRSGSTFTSQLLNRHPDTFYLFEPLTAAGLKAKVNKKPKDTYHEAYLNNYYFNL